MNEGIRERLSYGLWELGKLSDVIKDTHGNLSIREEDLVAIKPSGVPYSLIQPDDIYVVEINGRHGGGKLRPSVDLQHHLEIYRRHDWIRSICHTHSPYATAFALAGQDIECISTEQADYFGGSIACRSYRDLYSWGAELELDPREKAVLLEHHGCLTFGKEVVESVRLAEALENVAQKTFLARQIAYTRYVGSLRKPEIEKWHKRYQESYGQK